MTILYFLPLISFYIAFSIFAIIEYKKGNGSLLSALGDFHIIIIFLISVYFAFIGFIKITSASTLTAKVESNEVNNCVKILKDNNYLK